jgi:hypothetical protein
MTHNLIATNVFEEHAAYNLKVETWDGRFLQNVNTYLAEHTGPQPPYLPCEDHHNLLNLFNA